jgi:hypothetical protein
MDSADAQLRCPRMGCVFLKSVNLPLYLGEWQ